MSYSSFAHPVAGATTAATTTVDASGFNGNLETTDTDVQKVCAAVDQLTTGGGAPAAVDLSTYTTGDYEMPVGGIGYVVVSGATTVPLNVAMVEGAKYELHYQCSAYAQGSPGTDPIQLQMNNTTYGTSFRYSDVFHSTQTSGAQATANESLGVIKLGQNALMELHADLTCQYNSYDVGNTVFGYSLFYASGVVICQANFTNYAFNDAHWTSMGTIVSPKDLTGKFTVIRKY